MSDQPEDPLAQAKESFVNAVEIFMRHRAEKIERFCMEALLEGKGLVIVMESDGHETVFASEDVPTGTIATYPRSLHPEMWRDKPTPPKET